MSSRIATACIRSISIILLISAFAQTRADAAKKTAKPQEPMAQDTPLNTLADAPKPPSLACDGAFAKDTTHAKLVSEFGAKNVTFKDVEVASNTLTKASVIFDEDPTRRVVVYWKDNKTRTKPAAILVEAPSTWTGPGGVRNGLALKDVVKLNGDDFRVMGFGGIGGGEISGLKGPLADVPGGCTLKIKLEPGIAHPLPPRFASVTGDQYVASKNLVLRRVRPQVIQWSLNYQ